MKIVLDTNVLLSALIKKGKPRTVLSAIIRQHNLILSRKILEEFTETVTDPKIGKYAGERDIARFLRDIANAAKIIRVKSKFKVVKQDPDDDVILATAYDGNADYIVSGDKHLLKLKEFRGIKIVSVREMLDLLK